MPFSSSTTDRLLRLTQVGFGQGEAAKMTTTHSERMISKNVLRNVDEYLCNGIIDGDDNVNYFTIHFCRFGSAFNIFLW